MTRELPARMSPLASLVLSVLAILACGSGGALAGFALSRALGLAGVDAALLATVVGVAVAFALWVLGVVILSKLGWLR
jgi:hypothetical protein